MDPKNFKKDANLGLIYNFNDLIESSFTPGNSVFDNNTYSSPLFTTPSLTASVSQNFVKIEYTDVALDSIGQINSKMNVVHVGLNPINSNGTYVLIFQGSSVDNKQNVYIIIPFNVVSVGSSTDLYNLIEFYIYPQLTNTTKPSPPTVDLNNLIPNSKMIHITNPEPMLFSQNTIVITFDSPLQVTENSMMSKRGMNPIQNTTLTNDNKFTINTYGKYSANPPINNPTMSIDNQIYIDCSPVSMKQDKVGRELVALVNVDKAFGIFGDYSKLINGLIIIALLCGFIIVAYYLGISIYKTNIEIAPIKPVIPIKPGQTVVKPAK